MSLEDLILLGHVNVVCTSLKSNADGWQLDVDLQHMSAPYEDALPTVRQVSLVRDIDLNQNLEVVG